MIGSRAPAPALQLALMGAFDARLEGRLITDFPTQKTRALLAYLALDAGRLNERNTLSTVFWSDMPTQSALENLRKAIYRLRLLLPVPSDLFLVTSRTVSLNAAHVSSDVATFQRLIAECKTHRHAQMHTCADCISRLEQAVTLYHGELLEGIHLSDAPVFDEWLMDWREQLRNQILEVLNQFTDACQAQGQFDQARIHAARQIALDPFNEPAHRQLMLAMAHQGKRNEALAHFEGLRHTLLREFGIQPQPETLALHTTLRNQFVSPATPAATVTPVQRKRVVLHHLPAQLTRKVAREAELDHIHKTLLDPNCRLLTLTGMGGIGKTRLCVEAAERLAEAADEFRDGIYFVSLAGVEADELVAPAMLAALDIAVGSEPPEVTLKDYLRSRCCLLILDNFEQVASAAGLLVDVLGAAPGVKMLVSSREALNVRAEWRYEITGLPYPREAAGALDDFGAMDLFVDRVRHIRHDFQLDDSNRAAVSRICRLAEGMPLAIEIAATWLRMRSCKEIAEMIAANAAALTANLRDLPERHRSIDAVFMGSWQLLPAAQRSALARLSVMRGRFDAEAALAVTGASPDTLRALVEKSLLRDVAPSVYELHLLLRAFADAQLRGLGEGEVALARDQHSDYFLGFVRQQANALYGMQPKPALQAIQARLDNLRQAVPWAIERGRLDALRAGMDALGRFYRLASLFNEGEQTFAMLAERLENMDAEARDPDLLAHTLVWQADFLDLQSKNDAALSTAERGCTVAQHAGVTSQGRATCELGALLTHKGKFDRAIALQEEALALYRQAGDERGQAEALSQLGTILWRRSDYAAALSALQDALALQRRLRGGMETARLLNTLAGVSFERGEREQALAYIQQALQMYESMGDAHNIANCCGNLALVYQMLGKDDLALEYNQRDLAAQLEGGNRHFISIALGNRGSIYEGLGRLEDARDCYQRAMVLAEEAGQSWEAARDRASLAGLLNKMGQLEEAAHLLDQSLPVLLAHGADYYTLSPLLAQADVLRNLDRLDEALGAANNALMRATALDIQDKIKEAQDMIAAIRLAQAGAVTE